MEPTPPSGAAHLNDDELLDLAHGLREAMSGNLAHLKECARCESRFRSLASERARLLIRPRPLLTAGGIELASVATLPFGGGGTSPRDGLNLKSRLLLTRLVGFGLAAAIFLVALFALRVGPQRKPTGFWLPPPTEEALRSDAGAWASDPEIAGALEAYERHDVTGALARFRALAPDRGSDYFNSLRALYLASLLTRSGEDAEAQKTLEAVDMNSLPEPWRGRARFILQDSYRHQGRAAAADSLLRLLADQPGELGERARDALGR